MVIHFPFGKILKASVGLGHGTNNFAELKALHFLLCWLSHRNVHEAQIFGDFMNIVNWFNGTQRCRNCILLPLLNEISCLKCFFTELYVCHIYRERNHDADRLSKEGAEQDMGAWIDVELENGLARPIAQPVFV